MPASKRTPAWGAALSGRRPRLDLRGLLLLAPGIALFLYAMTEAGNQGGFDNTRTIATGAAGLALVALFVWHAGRRGKQAGAALAMPLAGLLTDKIGARLVVSAGLVVALLGTLAFTQLAAHTSYLYLSAALLVVGFGIGSLMVPSMAAVFQTLSREETPRATSALNTIQRIAGAIGHRAARDRPAARDRRRHPRQAAEASGAEQRRAA